MNHDELTSGRVLKAPENFLSKDGIKAVVAQARGGRRDFIRNAFAAAVAGAAAPAALSQVNPVPVEGGDANILVLPEHAKGLGLGVATDGYGSCATDARSGFSGPAPRGRMAPNGEKPWIIKAFLSAIRPA